MKLRVIDAENNECESNYIWVEGNDKSSCSLDMVVSSVGSRNSALNGVNLQWTDNSNNIYRSDNVSQPAESYFEIVNSKEYEPNERGESGRLLDLRFNVLISDGQRSIWFKSEKSSIAVSYK